jgi:hypothetical protein
MTIGLLLIAAGEFLILCSLASGNRELKARYNALMRDDGRLIDMLAERAKRQIDEELRRQPNP